MNNQLILEIYHRNSGLYGVEILSLDRANQMTQRVARVKLKLLSAKDPKGAKNTKVPAESLSADRSRTAHINGDFEGSEARVEIRVDQVRGGAWG